MGKLNLSKSTELWNEALDLVPGGVLGVRRPYNFVPGEYPYFLSEGRGGRVKDPDGNEYIDFMCSYGPLLIGHCEQEVDDAVMHQMKKGFCFTLCQPLQNELMRKLKKIIPCYEQGFTVKTGSDGTTAALRLARGFTGREKVIRCGYHGWHDWCVENHGGIPKKILEDVLEFNYNDLESLEKLLVENRGQIAAVIMTPIGHHIARPVEAPKPGFLEGVKKIVAQHGAVLIFDEIRTGFRMAPGGAQERYGVVPDIGVFGKAMANGYPIGVVAGRRDIMKCLADNQIFITSTFFPNSLEMAAALATIEIVEREKVCDRMWERGTRLLADIREIIDASGVDAHISGVPPMPYITFNADPDKKYKERRTLFFSDCIRRGLFMQPYHHSYFMHRTTDEDLEKAKRIIRDSLAEVKKNIP